LEQSRFSAYAWITNRLESGHCTSDMIYDSIENWLLYNCDLLVDWKPASAYL